MLALGDLYRDGAIGAPDGTAALGYYERARQAGLEGAARRIGDLYFDSSLLPTDYGRAAEAWESTSEGIPERAMIAVADHRRSLGEIQTAVGGYERALALGQGDAATRLATIYFDGEGVERNLALAEKYYLQSEQGIPDENLIAFGDAYAQGAGLPVNGERASAYYEAALTAGEASAALPLGDLYFDGKLVPRDLLRAADLYDRSGSGVPSATLRLLGEAFIAGDGVSADAGRGVRYLEQAVANGDNSVLARLGDLYSSGQSIPADIPRAEGYYLDAAKAGDGARLLQLASRYVDGSEPAGTPERGVELLRIANDAAVPGAALALANAVFDGTGTEADPEQGAAILEAALADGDMPAGKRLLVHYLGGKDGVSPQLDNARRVLSSIATSLDPQEAAYTSVMLAARSPGSDSAMTEMTTSFAQLERDRQAEVVLALKGGNENVYVHLVQSLLVSRGYFDGDPNGQLNASTIRAIREFCTALDRQQDCAAGPLSPGANTVIADGIRQGIMAPPAEAQVE